MIIGNPSVFAIESGITQAYQRLSQRALGYFVIHIGGNSYGIHTPEATMLACSFDGVMERISNRGNHSASILAKQNAIEIVDAISAALYDSKRQDEIFFGMPCAEFLDFVYENKLIWAPDGDEAFDDGSHVLQFDVDDRVRLIAFTINSNGVYEKFNLIDRWINADEFYSLLDEWQKKFEIEWLSTPKADGVTH